MIIRKSVLGEVDELRLAVEMVELGARLQVLESEVSISRDRLTRLYKEVRGVSPPKGQLPSSPEWFLTWRQNVHSSLFLCAYRFLTAQHGSARIQRILSAYRLYAEQVVLIGEQPILSFTRAWTLLRFVECGTLAISACRCCGGSFVRHNYDLQMNFVCGLCAPPPRAAKGRKQVAQTAWAIGQTASEQPVSIDEMVIARQAEAALRQNVQHRVS